MSQDFTGHLKSVINLHDLISQDVKLTESADGWRGAHENKHPSESGNCLLVNSDRWTCFHCHEGGDIFDWIASAYNLHIQRDFIEILKITAEFAGIPLPEYQIPRVYECLTSAAGYFNSCLTGDMYEEILTKWGITRETVDELKIGYIMNEKTRDGRSLMEFLLNEGFTKDEIVSTGLYRKDNRKYVQISNSRYIFPYYEGNIVKYLIARRTSHTKDTMGKYVKLKTQGTKNKAKYISPDIKNILFGLNSVKIGGEFCIITEGITDAIMAIQSDMPCISPVTTRLSMTNAKDILPYVKMFKRVYICNDSEDNSAGLNGAIKTAHYLIDNGVDARIVHLPRREGISKVDLSNYLRENSVDEFKMLMDIAKPPDKIYIPDADDFYTEDGRFNITYFCDWVLSEHSGEHFMSFTDSKPNGVDLYYYIDGVYHSNGANYIENMIDRIVGIDVSTNASREVVKRIRRSVFINRNLVDNNPEILNIKNGLLNLRTMKLSPHVPDVYSLVQLPRTYTTEHPDLFLDFLEEILPMSKQFADQEVMLTMMGYCLLKSYPEHKFFLLYGSGNNGKGTLLHVIREMIGSKNVSSVSIQDLTDRFRPAELYNKLANICGDLSDKYVQDSSGLKTLTGEDTILAERKGEHPFEFENYAKLLFATNSVPYIADRDGSNAIYNRMAIVEFGEDFTDRMDTGLRSKLTQVDELDAIFSYVCVYAQSILIEDYNHANFGPGRGEMANRYAEFRVTPTERFIKDCIKYTGKNKDFVKQSKLYNKYLGWYQEGKLHGEFTGSPIGATRFYKMVGERLGIKAVVATKNKENGNYYLGVKMLCD